MTKLIVIGSIIILIIIFALQNTQRVYLNLFFMGPVQERLVFLLVGSYIAGILTLTFINMILKYREGAKKDAKRKSKKEYNMAKFLD